MSVEDYTQYFSGRGSRGPSDPPEPSDEVGNIYFDFNSRAEDYENKRGILSQFKRLREIKNGAYFSIIAVAGENEILSYVNAVLPEGLPQTFLVSNISLDEKPYLSIRPAEIGPMLERVFPEGRSLSFIGSVSDNRRDPDNPIFQVHIVADICHSAPRPFERKLTAHVDTANKWQSKRNHNVLDAEFCESLPVISIETEKRLEDWFGYLDWKEKLIQAGSGGIRYLKIDCEDGGLLRFLVAGSSEGEFPISRRLLGDESLCASELSSSEDPWQFKLREGRRIHGRDIGEFVKIEEPEDFKQLLPQECPIKKPVFAYVYYRLTEQAQDIYDRSVERGADPQAAAELCLKSIPDQGFLALSNAGDLALVNRQRRELQQLMRQSGYAPFLSSYIFDIKAANQPPALVEIAEDDWSNDTLNDDQKRAVRKMISAPDLALIQGPPGTGKTTMIAEATYHFVRGGKRVLLVSQASLAVNNALERLPHIPEIRGIRLSRRTRENEDDHPYSQSSALKTYYSSIAACCSERTLNGWSKSDEEIDSLSKWLEDAKFIQSDLSGITKDLDSLDAEISQQENVLEDLKSRRAQAREREQRIDEIGRIRGCIKGAEAPEVTVSEVILNAFHDDIVPLFEMLEAKGLAINKYWHSRDYGTREGRSGYFFNIISRWKSLVALRSQIEGDIKRLEGLKGETVLSPSVESRLEKIKRDRDRLQEAMDAGDDSKIKAWRNLNSEIRKLEREGRGFESGPYAEVFNTDSEPWLVLSGRDSVRSELLDVLRRLSVAIEETTPLVENALQGIDMQLQEAAESIPAVEVDDEGIRQLEITLREFGERRSEINKSLIIKKQRMSDLIDRRPVGSAGLANPVATIREAEARLLQLEKDAQTGGKFRDAWSPILKAWVNDLGNEETLSNDQHHFFENYVRACNVVGVTCTEGRRTLDEAGHSFFDTVIVDEVSKATPTEMMMPLMMGRAAILVGDHRQLPPLFKEKGTSLKEVQVETEESEGEENNADALLTEENMRRYEKMVSASLFKEHFENAPDSLKASLFTQYRMHPQIMQVVNKFYENKLECGLRDPDGIHGIPDEQRLHGLTLRGERGVDYVSSEIHAVWIDSSTDPEGTEHFERRDLGTSKVNELEAALIAKALCDMETAYRGQGYGADGKDPKSVGVVTFYGRQVRAIREAVRRAEKLYGIHFKAIKIDINTVDRYQGQERPIVVVSMVRNPGHRLSRRANTAQFERINVAFSRAQELLVVVGANNVFCRYPVKLPNMDRPGKTERPVYRDIIGEIKLNGGYWQSSSVISNHDYTKLLPRGFKPKRRDRGRKGGGRGRSPRSKPRKQ